jgi:hypothetical protein
MTNDQGPRTTTKQISITAFRTHEDKLEGESFVLVVWDTQFDTSILAFGIHGGELKEESIGWLYLDTCSLGTV